MSELLANFLAGQWISSSDSGTPLHDPVLGNELGRVSSRGADLDHAFRFARREGGGALRALTYEQRAKALSACVAVLKQNRDRYLQISLENSGTTAADSSIDVDGAIFTLDYFAKLGQCVGPASFLRDREWTDLSRDASFQVQHVLTSRPGLALLINAFNFPAWGLWEKAAPALLSGVPVVVKPATPTAWLAHAMIQDVINAGALPVGALSIVCGRSEALLDALEPFDVLSFTGSAGTASLLRLHAAVASRSVRTNIESDSVNSALLAPSVSAGSAGFRLFVKEIVREMTSKSGQKCTAIRRAFVPLELYDATAAALIEALSSIKSGNPRDAQVSMGSLVSKRQRAEVEKGIALLEGHCAPLVKGERDKLIDVSSEAAVVPPWLFGCKSGASSVIHTTEVFGPVSTLVAYRSVEEACAMSAAGEGSLVASVFGEDPAENASLALKLAPIHGRVHVVSPTVAKSQTGHGNVMPMSLHGGPGRAGGGAELGGLRGLEFYHQRTAVQAETASLEALKKGSPWTY